MLERPLPYKKKSTKLSGSVGICRKVSRARICVNELARQTADAESFLASYMRTFYRACCGMLSRLRCAHDPSTYVLLGAKKIMVTAAPCARGYRIRYAKRKRTEGVKRWPSRSLYSFLLPLDAVHNITHLIGLLRCFSPSLRLPRFPSD